MAEYIDRKAAIAAVKLIIGDQDHECKAMMDFYHALWNIPAADVAPVVRCRDCKHFNMKSMECENEAVSTDHEGGASYSLNFYLDDFCSYGERRKANG